MNGASRWVVVGVVVASAALAPVAFARGGGHRGGRRGGASGGDLCVSPAFLDLSLSNIDMMIAPNATQKAALDALKKISKENADDMSRVCAGDSPMNVPAKLAASEKRLEAALAGVRKITPAAEKFYASLSDAQKAQVDSYVYWPGL